MNFQLDIPSLLSLCGGAARHLFSISLSQKLLINGVLITCAEVWLVKSLTLEKAGPRNASFVEPVFFLTPPTVYPTGLASPVFVS
jgi:hypothetical protein